MTESEFIQKLISGDRNCYGILVAQYGPKVLNTAISISQNKTDAEDITQEVFIEIFQSISQFKSHSKLSTWIYKITVNKSLDFLRKKKRKKRMGIFQSLFHSENELAIREIPHFEHPGIQLENKERATTLFQAIDQLPENQKTAYVLSKLENLSYTEIAEVMELSLPAVESLLFRAKQNLQKLLRHYYENNEK